MRPRATALALPLVLPGLVFGQTLQRAGTLAGVSDVRFTAVSPDGRQIAAAGADGKLRLFTLPAGALSRTLDTGDLRLDALAFSANGRRLAAAGTARTVVFDVASGARVGDITGFAAWIGGIALSPDGGVVGVAPYDLPAELWNVADGNKIASLGTRFAGSSALAFSPDGQLLASANSDTTVTTFAARTGQLLWTFDELDLEPFALDFSPDAKTLLVGGADKVVVALDAKTGKATNRMARQADPIGAVNALGDGRTVIAACMNADKMAEVRAILAWNWTTGAIATVAPGGNFNGAGRVADGRVLLTASGSAGLELWAVK